VQGLQLAHPPSPALHLLGLPLQQQQAVHLLLPPLLLLPLLLVLA
jgi:hypothetical protein